MLHHIPDAACPLCGETQIVEESLKTHTRLSDGVPEIREHVNGGRWETRRFLCGQALHYVPNAEHVTLSEYAVCTMNAAYHAREQARTDAAQHLIAVIQGMPVDESFRQELLNSLPWHYRPSD